MLILPFLAGNLNKLFYFSYISLDICNIYKYIGFRIEIGSEDGDAIVIGLHDVMELFAPKKNVSNRTKYINIAIFLFSKILYALCW
jgi:hypothetical protein